MQETISWSSNFFQRKVVGDSPLLMSEELVKNSRTGKFWFRDRCLSRSRGSLES